MEKSKTISGPWCIRYVIKIIVVEEISESINQVLDR
jgi:hypothetical protein